MSEFTVSFDGCMEAARLAATRGDRLGTEQSLAAAIAAAGGTGMEVQRSTALMKLGELKRDAGHLAEAEELFVHALDVLEGQRLTDDASLGAALTNLAAIRTARGAPEEAEALLIRALALTERRLGREHPDLVVLLNDLSRLYLKRSAFNLAEPLLNRLHAIKRLKGEEHPEVATVLASLATVRQALGDHDAAEQLWRRVLAIRERTLAPNHFAIATAIEHLAETCSARGKLGEALRLFHRALAMREMTLGIGHPSLRASRERIADLQLQDGEEFAAGSGAADAVPMTDWRVPAPVDRPEAEPPTSADFSEPAVAPHVLLARIRDLPARDRGARTPVSTPQVAMSPAALAPAAVATVPIVYAQPAEPELEVPTWTDREQLAPPAMPVERASQRLSVIFPTAPAVAFDDEDLSDDYDAVDGRMQNISASIGGLLRQRRTYAIAAGAIAVTLAVVAAATASQPRAGEAEPAYVRPATSERSAAGLVSLADSAGAPAGALASQPAQANDTQKTIAGLPDSPRAGAASPTPDRTPAKPTSRDLETVQLPAASAIPRPVAGISTAQLDAAMRSASVARPSLAVPIAEQSFGGGDVTIGKVDYGTTAPKDSPPILIGAVPRVPYPQNLRAKGRERGGEVLVEFSVDTTGRAVMNSLRVVHTDHELLATAVEGAIPSMRFHPAQAGGKKTTGRVQVAFHFSVTRD